MRKNGEVVAGAVIFTAGRTAAYLYGATNDDALPLRAGYFMQWNIIRWLRDNTRAEFYDLGGTDGFQGLHQFKKGLVGTEGLITPVPPICNYRLQSSGAGARHCRLHGPRRAAGDQALRQLAAQRHGPSQSGALS